METIAVLQETVAQGASKLSECCSAVYGLLPDHQLTFLPSFAIALVISAVVLVYLLHKDSKKPWKEAVKLFLYQLFCGFPAAIETLEIVNHQELLDKVSLRWQNNKIVQRTSERLREAIKLYIEGVIYEAGPTTQNKKSKKLGKVLPSCKIYLKINSLSLIAWWSDYTVFNQEKTTLQTYFPKIKKEFLTVFGEFQKGNCKRWRRVELSNGHSCEFVLVKQGVIDTDNSKDCPNTFQALRECRALGLSGCVFGSCSFTLLYPDTTVTVDQCYSNTALQCFLVLQESATGGHLTIQGCRYRWQEGAVMLWDPSVPNTYSLPSSKDMTELASPLALLSFTLWHPGLEHSEKIVISDLFTS